MENIYSNPNAIKRVNTECCKFQCLSELEGDEECMAKHAGTMFNPETNQHFHDISEKKNQIMVSSPMNFQMIGKSERRIDQL